MPETLIVVAPIRNELEALLEAPSAVKNLEPKQDQNKFIVTRELNSMRTDIFEGLYSESDKSKYYHEGHRYTPNLGLSLETAMPSQLEELFEHAKSFYKEVFEKRNIYNIYPINDILPDHFGNFATLKGRIQFPDFENLDLDLFSFSQEKTFFANNPDILIDYQSDQHKNLVLSDRINGTESLITLKDAVINNFRHKKNNVENRNSDTEFKLLEYICRLISKRKISKKDFANIVGEIVLESERSCCESCNNVITMFKNLFPSIKLIFRSYFGDQNSRYTKDGIVFVPSSSVHLAAYERFLDKS
jgi:The  BURPS668_1122 family of deaminases